MKKLAVFLMCLSVSMFALGCGGGDTKKAPAKPPAEKKTDEKKPEEKKPEDTSKPPEEKKES